jgi:hypothetical protein
MFKMSMGVAALLAAGLLGLACFNQAGLNPGGGIGGAAGVVGGGQTGGVAGGSGGTIGVGGIVAGSSGSIGSGGVRAGGTNGTAGAGGTSACLPTACPALACVSGFLSNPDPCGCPICPPNPDAGVTKDAGGRDGPICPGPVPPCAPPPKTCPAGYEFNSPPCGCTSCIPVDGGTVTDAGKKDAAICPPINCPALLCVTGLLPSPEPCGCPVCPPNPDAGLASPDAGLACCPIGFSLYDCKQPGGGAGFACHNPALGCASSLTCGQGCDPQVSGRCGPDQDAGAKPPVDAACVDNILCIAGDHFDSTLCKCVPDTSTTSCSKASDCTGALPALCEICANGSTGCAHFTCVAGQCQVAYCP